LQEIFQKVFQFIEPEKEENHQVIVQSSSPTTQLYNYGIKIERYIEPTKFNVFKHESREPTLI
jgi:carbamoylphosphate synthase large subunit